MSGNEFVKESCFFLAKEERCAVRGAGSISSASVEESGEPGVFYAVSQSQSNSHSDSTSRSEFPTWHYFACSLITLKEVGLRLVCIAKR